MDVKPEKREKLLPYMPLLIEEVQKREWLWNPKHQFHNHKKKIKRSWDDISKKINLPVPVCKTKWKNLKDVFRRELRKYGTVDAYAGAWQFFERISFLSIIQPPPEQGSTAVSPRNNGNPETQFIKFEHVESNYSDESHDDESNEYPVKAELADLEDPLPLKFEKIAEEDDSDMMFLKSLAPYMRQLDPVRKLVVRNKIQGVLISELGLNSNNCSF